MRRMLTSRHLVISAFSFSLAMVCGLQAADRAEITFADARIFPESLTSTKNGDLYFGSLGLDAVYRATSKNTQAAGGRGGAPYVGETALKAFNLKDASFKASYAFPGNGLCNDIAVAKDGTVYAADTIQGRVLRLKKGAGALDVWASDPMLLATADGLALLEDGNLYINSVGQSTLMRIDVKADGSAGAITKLETSRPLMGPDGMRSVGKKTLLLVEGGRLDEVTINGNKAEIKVLKDGMTGITAVTLTGGNAYVVEAKLNLRADTTKDPGPFKAMGISYKA